MLVKTFAAAGMCLLLASAALAGANKPAFQIIGGMPSEAPQFDLTELENVRLPANLAATVVPYSGNLAPGSILVRTRERRLYLVLPNNQAKRYAVGVGRQGFTWSGSNRITAKAIWPTWTPPQVMIEREAERGHYLPESMPGGPGNPLGARALYIGHTDYRIHGTTEPWSIGKAVSSGCIRMVNADVVDLFNRVQVGTLVVVE